MTLNVADDIAWSAFLRASLSRLQAVYLSDYAEIVHFRQGLFKGVPWFSTQHDVLVPPPPFLLNVLTKPFFYSYKQLTPIAEK